MLVYKFPRKTAIPAQIFIYEGRRKRSFLFFQILIALEDNRVVREPRTGQRSAWGHPGARQADDEGARAGDFRPPSAPHTHTHNERRRRIELILNCAFDYEHPKNE